MSTIERRQPATLHPLVAGERLDRATFHERYEAMPPGRRAELIGGVVHMMVPISHGHGKINDLVIVWSHHYERFTRGIEALGHATWFLDDRVEVEPDAAIRILPEFGGQSRSEDQYLGGAPELVVEIARSSRPVDLGPKKEDYRRVGIREYLVVALDPDDVFWHARRRGRYVRRSRPADGCYRSKVFPGLWIDSDALFRCDLDGLIAALDRGLATPEHAAFVARLEQARRHAR
jgi:Uma2 family endonuclease